MRPLTTLRLAATGRRSDTVRIALTAVGAALGTVALLASVTVLSIVTPAGVRISTTGQPMVNEGGTYDVVDLRLPYTNALLNEDGLRPGVALALILLTIPVLAFVGQCSRLGAPARDSRLAAIRMAGGTARQVMWIAAVETGLAAALGVAVGFGTYFLGRYVLDNPDANGARPVPTDVLPGPAWLIAVAAIVPLSVTLLSVAALRRVAVTPLGVVRRTDGPRPNLAPGLLILAGIGIFALLEPISQYLERGQASPASAGYLLGGLAFIGLMLASAGIVLGTGWLTYTAGRLLHRFANRPAGLLAGRRMMADPWAGSRTFAAMLVALVIGALAAGLHAWTNTENRAAELSARRLAEALGERYLGGNDNGFYDRAYQLIGYAVVVAVVIAAAGLLVALADGIVARRRTLSALVAAGTPRGVLARATAWQVLAPVVPAVLLAVSAGILLPRRVIREVTSGQVTACLPAPGDPVEACADPAYAEAHLVSSPEVTLPVPVPWEQLALLGGGAVISTVMITAVGLLFLRMSTSVEELRAT